MVCLLLTQYTAYILGACYIGYIKPALYHAPTRSNTCLYFALFIYWSAFCLLVAYYTGAHYVGTACMLNVWSACCLCFAHGLLVACLLLHGLFIAYIYMVRLLLVVKQVFAYQIGCYKSRQLHVCMVGHTLL